MVLVGGEMALAGWSDGRLGRLRVLYPSLQTSLMVHGWPSLQSTPFVSQVECQQPSAPAPVGEQWSPVHGLPSSQVLAVPLAHAPALQPSFAVHGLPSEHGALFGAATQPLAEAQLSSVHGLPSSQPCAVQPMQPPDAHLAPTWQALPSLQTSPS